MGNHPKIVEYLAKVGAYADKDPPDIITSGESLTPYLINTEKLCMDKDIETFLTTYGDNSSAVITHAKSLMAQHPEFKEVINILAETVKLLLPIRIDKKAIAGGQRRDWIFSGPVAATLNLPHISLYKNGNVGFISQQGKFYDLNETDFYTVLVSDLLTKASSDYRIEKEREKGWIPMLRNRGSTIDNKIVVVTRLQGGEGILSKQGVNTRPLVSIDEEFLNKNSTQPEVVLDYTKDDRAWTENYLLKNGPSILVPYFEPQGKKLPRAKAFLKIYQQFLQESGLIHSLEKAVQKNYNKSLAQID